MASSKINPQINLSELSDSDKEIDKECPRFIVIKSQGNPPLRKLSPLLLERVITCKPNPKLIKKLRNGNLLVDVNEKKTRKTY